MRVEARRGRPAVIVRARSFSGRTLAIERRRHLSRVPRLGRRVRRARDDYPERL